MLHFVLLVRCYDQSDYCSRGVAAMSPMLRDLGPGYSTREYVLECPFKVSSKGIVHLFGRLRVKGPLERRVALQNRPPLPRSFGSL